MSHISRNFEKILLERLKSKTLFIQCVLGPRQVGKTTGVLQVLQSNFLKNEYTYISAEGELSTESWLREYLSESLQKNLKIIAIDEIQKIKNWNEILKSFWDLLKKNKKNIHIVILGSSSLQLINGLGESLAGRYEIISVHQWGFEESVKLKKMSLTDYMRFGGYPASYALLKDNARFKNYILESIFENVVNKDILRFAQIKKPGLFRQVFLLISQNPAKVISYNKIMGQLVEAGNVDQIKHYLDLYEQAFLIKLIYKKSKSLKSRTSSPKILIKSPVFSNILSSKNSSDEQMGFIFESIVGTRLVEKFQTVNYWAEGPYEIDFIVEINDETYAIEVKKNYRKSISLEIFRKKYPNVKSCVITEENYSDFEKDCEKFILKYSI